MVAHKPGLGVGKAETAAEVDVVAQGGSIWIEVKCHGHVDVRSASWTGGGTRKGVTLPEETYDRKPRPLHLIEIRMSHIRPVPDGLNFGQSTKNQTTHIQWQAERAECANKASSTRLNHLGFGLA